MEITAYKCSECNFLTENKELYKKHILNHEANQRIENAFPSIEDLNCNFANGKYYVQRGCIWLQSYKEFIEKEAKRLKIKYKPWSYSWFRWLDDGNSFLYGSACRTLNICSDCFREWGQPYYAINCKHGRED